MSKRFRFIFILFIILIGVVFLYPTVKWYFFVPESKKELASVSREQIRLYSRQQAKDSLDEFKTLSPDAPLPGKFSFLISTAKNNYKLASKKVPSEWTARAVRDSFPGDTLGELEDNLFSAFESHYRDQVLALKDMKTNILNLGLDLSGGMSVVLEADMGSLEKRLGHVPSQAESEEAISLAMEILSNRIDQFGVTEPEIRRQGQDQIVVNIPGDPDPERVGSFLRGKGSLNFHLVDEEATQQMLQYQQEHPEYDPALSPKPDFIPAGSSVRGFYTKDKYGLDQLIRYIVIKDEVALDGSHLKSAAVGRDQVSGRPTVNFALDAEGGEIFFKVTDANVGKSLAVVMDDKVKSYARISEAIRNNVQISGLTQEEAQNLALVLKTAALPVDLVIQNINQVGASLGADAIHAGLRAITLGFILVVVFMLAYYKGAGIVADIALVLNLFLMVSILSVFNMTLTLTSLAGLILTVGMAVDANVIIYERIKEEYRLGKSAAASVKAGFQKAFWTIMDSNITTFIAAIFLSQLGSGPVKGFAVTLAVGIVSSMFTALFVARLIFDFTVETLKASKLSISWRT